MAWDESLTEIRGILISYFKGAKETKRLAQQARINTARVDISGSPEQFWHDLLEEADKQGMVEKLIRAALKVYDRPKLRSALSLELKRQKGGGRPPRPPNRGEKIPIPVIVAIIGLLGTLIAAFGPDIYNNYIDNRNLVGTQTSEALQNEVEVTEETPTVEITDYPTAETQSPDEGLENYYKLLQLAIDGKDFFGDAWELLSEEHKNRNFDGVLEEYELQWVNISTISIETGIFNARDGKAEVRATLTAVYTNGTSSEEPYRYCMLLEKGVWKLDYVNETKACELD